MRKILMLAIMAMLIFTAGCDNPQPPNLPEPKQDPPKISQTDKPERKSDTAEHKNEPQNTNNSSVQVKTQKINAYYPDESGTKLVAVERDIKFVDESEKYSAAVHELMKKPKEKELTTIFPSHAKIKSVTRNGDTAVVDFDESISKGFVGGSTGEEFLINSIVDTLTSFDEVKQVKFLLNGKEVETLSGHMDLSEPIKKTQ